MPYKDKEKNKIITLKNYYKNREKRLRYQRDYDNKNKDKKREHDKKRRKLEKYNKEKNIQHYSQKYHFQILLEKYGGCQLNLEGCDNKKLEIHHKRYTKKINDCLLVCQNCHKKIHRKSLE